MLVPAWLSEAQVNPELNDLIKHAFTYYPRVQEADRNIEINEVRVELAEAGYLPVVSGTASYSYVNPVSKSTFPMSATEVRTLQFLPYNNYNTNVSLNQVIWDFGKTKAQVEKAKADLLVAQQNRETVKLQLAAQVVNIYYSLVYLKQAMAVQDTVILFYEKNRKIVEGKLRQGDALKIDLSNIDNSIQQEKNRKLDFQRQLERQVALLQYTTGVALDPKTAGFDFEVAGLATSLSVEGNPDVVASAQRIQAAQSEALLAQRNRLPSLSLQAGAGFRNGYQPDIDAFRFNYLAGVTLAVPIYQGKRLSKSVVIAQRSVQLQELSRTNLTNTLQKDWTSAQADLNAAVAQQQNALIQIEATQEALRLTQVRYHQGVATYLDLVFASSNLQRSQLNLLQYQYQACLAKAELARLQGARFWQE